MRLFDFRDERPDREKQSFSYSRLITNCNFGIQNLGEPNPVGESRRLVRLRDQMQARLGERLRGATIIVRRYTVSLDMGGLARRVGVSAALGPGIGGTVPLERTRPSCSHDRMQAGWFDPADLEFQTSPIIVEIEISVDGTIFHVDSARSEARAFSSLRPNEREEANRMMFAALDKANNALVTRMEAGLTAR